MNTHVDIRSKTNMTSKGQVLIPKDVRDRVGLVPGNPVNVGINDRGEAVVTAVSDLPDNEPERSAAIRTSILEAVGTIDTGLSTEAKMRELRGDDDFI